MSSLNSEPEGDLQGQLQSYEVCFPTSLGTLMASLSSFEYRLPLIVLAVFCIL